MPPRGPTVRLHLTAKCISVPCCTSIACCLVIVLPSTSRMPCRPGRSSSGGSHGCGLPPSGVHHRPAPSSFSQPIAGSVSVRLVIVRRSAGNLGSGVRSAGRIRRCRCAVSFAHHKLIVRVSSFDMVDGFRLGLYRQYAVAWNHFSCVPLPFSARYQPAALDRF